MNPKMSRFCLSVLVSAGECGQLLVRFRWAIVAMLVFPGGLLPSPAAAQTPKVSLVLTRTAGIEQNGVSENGGEIAMSATMDIASASTVTITIAVVPAPQDPHAYDGRLLVEANNVLTIPAGATASTDSVTISVVDNAADEPSVQAYHATAAISLGRSTFQEFLVYDDDPQPVPTVVLNPSKLPEAGGVSTVTVTISNPTKRGNLELNVQAAASTLPPSGGDTLPNQATANDVTLSQNKRLTIAAGQTRSTGTVTITAQRNPAVTPDRYLPVRVHNINQTTVPMDHGPPPSNNVLHALYAATSHWLLLELEGDPPPEVSITPQSEWIFEGDDAAFWVVASYAPPADLPINLIAGGGVLPGPRNVVLSAGSDSVAWSVSTKDNFDSEERFVTLQLEPGAKYSRNPSRSNAKVEVRKRPDPTPVASFASASSSAGESAGARNIRVNLNPAPKSAITLRYDVGGAAMPDSDYTALSGSVSISSGASSGHIPVTITNDSVDENDETIILTLKDSAGYTVGSANRHVLTITDDDDLTPPAPTVNLSVSPNPVPEGQSVTVTARLSRAMSENVTIPLVLTAGTAESGDYGSLTSIAIPGGQTEGKGTIATTEDADEDNETFTVALGAPMDGVAPGNPSSMEVMILDRTSPPTTTPSNRNPTLTASCDPCSVPRGGELRLTATASDPDGDPLRYVWSAAKGRFAGPADDANAQWVAPPELGAITIRVDVSDSRGGTASAEVEIEVVNLPPAFGQDVYRFELQEGEDGRQRPIDLGRASAEDPDNDELAYEIASGDKERFAVAAQTGMVRYVGAGEDFKTEPSRFELTMRVRDGFGAEAETQVVVTVTDVNTPPEVSASCNPCSVPRGGKVRLTATASDPDGDPLRYAWSAAKGRFAGPADGANAQWVAPPELGSMTIRMDVSDGRGGAAADEVEIEVVNLQPAFGQDVYRFELQEGEDGRQRPIDLGRAGAEDPDDDDELTYEIASGDKERFAVAAQTGMVRYVGAGEDFETEPNRFEMTVRARDGVGGEARAEVVIEVTDKNEAPEAMDDMAETVENEAITVDVLANDTDPDGNRLRVETVSTPSNGTTRIAPDGGVTYAPAAYWYGVDTFAYVVSDGEGLTATANVEVAVRPVNDAPVATGSIPDQTLDEGGSTIEVDLSPFFDDKDGDPLTYFAESSDPDVVTVATAGTILTLTPATYGPAMVTVTVEDPGGLRATQAFQVSVSDRPQYAILENLLAATARGHLASLRTALGDNIRANPCEAPRLSVMGQSVPLGRKAAATMLETTRDRARSAATALRLETEIENPSADPVFFTAPGAQSPLERESAGRAADRRATSARSVPAQALSWGGRQGGTDFLLSWGGENRAGDGCSGRGRWSLWGQGDVQRFEGTPGVQGYEAGYDGALSTGYAGIDAGLGKRWRAGVALSRSRSVGDWRAGASNGELTQTMTAIHPYLRWTGKSASILGSAGAGRGDAENLRESGRLGASAMNLRLGLVELKKRLGKPGGLDFSLLGDAAWAALWTDDGAETIDGQDVRVNQIRIGANLSLPTRLGKAALTPFGNVYARRDGGAGQNGSGVEVAGGLRAVLGVVRLDAKTRMLAIHSAAGYSERGAALSLAFGRQGGEGLSLSVSPRWGDPTTGLGALDRDPGNHRNPNYDRWTLDARGSYRITLPDGRRLELFSGYSALTRIGVGLTLDRAGRMD